MRRFCYCEVDFPKAHPDLNSPARLGWREAFLLYTRPRVVAMFFLGFSAGLPLLLVFSTLTAWLTEMEVSRSAIGFFGLVGITYSIKVLWAPVVDRIPLPGLTRWFGQRRSWMLIGQFAIATGLALMAFIDPSANLTAVALAAVLVAFASSTQDIAIDAFRIESAIPEHQGAMSANYIFGYRVALLVAGAGALYIAEFGSWPVAYLSMAALMGVGVVTVLLVSEPERQVTAETEALERRLRERLHAVGHSPWRRIEAWLLGAVVGPFADFFRRNGAFALLILLFISLFRVGDIVMGIMANPFYLDLGFSKEEIANIGKLFGFVMTILGTYAGGLLVARYGLYGPLLLGACLVASTNLLFAQLAQVGYSLGWLTLVISADHLSAGLSTAAFVAYLSSLTNRAYTATQYALFSSLMTLPGKFTSGFSGIIVDAHGYAWFFTYAAIMGIPAILLALLVWRHARRTERVGG